MRRLMLIRHLPAAIAYVAREAGKSWGRYWTTIEAEVSLHLAMNYEDI